jgi:hypothetical protein
MSQKPPLELSVVITAPDGTEHHWASHKAAQDRPSGVQFSTASMDGFKTASLTLPRRIDLDWPDLNLFDDVALIGADGSVAYEGRVSAQPRQLDASHSITVQAVGWMAHAKDRKLTEIYVDRDFGHWGPVSVQYRFNNGASFAQTDPTVLQDADTGQPALEQGVVGDWDATGQPDAEAVYDARGIAIGSLYYAWKKSGSVDNTLAGWKWNTVLAPDDTLATGDLTANLRAAGPGTGTLTATTSSRKYAATQFYWDGGVSTAKGVRYSIFWTVLAVYGNHGLTKRGTNSATEAQGFYASDVIKNIAGRFCPKLNTAGVQDTTYAIPQLAFIDPVHPYDAFLACNAYHLWRLAVWENKTLTYGPVDLSDYDWQVRLSDPGVTVELQGDDTSSLANGIVVTFQDVNKGAQRRLTPDDHSELADDAVENPANRAGLQVWTEIPLSAPTTEDAALQIGRIALAEFNQPKAPGTITVRGHIRDRAGHWQPVWRVRADDTIAIVDHPNDRPRLVQETSYSHDSQTMQIAVDGSFKRLDAVLDRLGTALSAANLA